MRKRWRWSFVLPIVGLGAAAAYGLASGIGALAGGKYLPLDPAALAKPSRTSAIDPSRRALPRDVAAAAILEGNPFDSVTGPIRSARSTATDVSRSELVFSDEVARCATPARVAISVVDPARRHRSMAVLEWEGGGVGRTMVREGHVVEGRRVAAIARERVYLREPNAYCYVGLTTPSAATTAIVRAPSSTSPPLGSPPALSSAIARGIHRVDATHVQIDRLVLDSALDDPGEHLKTVRVAPEMQGGKMIGVRMLSVRADGLFDKLGLQGGDVLTSINGFPLTSAEEGLAALGRLRTAPTLDLSVVRNGAAMSIAYDVR